MASLLQKIEGDESVLLRVTHSNLKTFSSEVRFSLQSSVESVKDKLWRKCGTSVDSMSLELYDDSNTKVADLSDNARPLGFYSPLDGFRIHVIDLDPSSVTSGGWLEDTSLVEKYTISEEDYKKRDGTFRKFKEKMASVNPSAFEPKITDNHMQDLCANIKVGDRCEVEPGAKRGVVKFVGRAESLAPGFWVGSVKSLISMPCFMSHASIPAEVREARGLTEDLVRISVGIEDVNDLIADLDNALRTGPA